MVSMVLHIRRPFHWANLRCSNLCLTLVLWQHWPLAGSLRHASPQGLLYAALPAGLHSKNHLFTALLSRYTQLTLEQHWLELHGFIYRRFFPMVNTAMLNTGSVVGWIHGCRGTMYPGLTITSTWFKGQLCLISLLIICSFLFTARYSAPKQNGTFKGTK